MKKILAVALVATTACASQSGTSALPVPAGVPTVASPTLVPGEPLVEFEMMTWPEVKAALAAGKTTALFYTGGTEHRGPQNVNGGHNLIGKATVKAIALRLGNAIAMPVLPYTPNNASATLPGTIGLTPEILAAILERVSEQAIITGFKNVVLMGDHGGGQGAGPGNVYRAVAQKLDAKYAEKGIHVYYVDEVYGKRQADFDAYLKEKGYPVSSHAGIPDTSEMIYLGEKLGWVRMNELPNAIGDTLPRGAPGPRVNNGVSGDGRRASAELGKIVFDMKIDYAVRQIRSLIK